LWVVMPQGTKPLIITSRENSNLMFFVALRIDVLYYQICWLSLRIYCLINFGSKDLLITNVNENIYMCTMFRSPFVYPAH
jgi:hypothetical protein